MTSARRAELLVGALAWLVKLWLWTLRYRVFDPFDVLQSPPGRPLIWSFWHNRLFVMPYVCRRFFPQGRPVALTSASKDGEYVVAFVKQFGATSIRGSTSRGGAAALIQMKRALAAGHLIGFTPDGPRGPRYELHPGLIKLSQISGAAILPIRVTYSNFWQLGSWDGFMIPKPFARVNVAFGALHFSPVTDNDSAFEEERRRVEELLGR